MSITAVEKLLQENFKSEHLLNHFKVISEAVKGWNGKDAQPVDKHSLNAFRTFLCRFGLTDPEDVNHMSIFLSTEGLISLEVHKNEVKFEVKFNKDESVDCWATYNKTNPVAPKLYRGFCEVTPFKELLLSEQLRLSLL